MRFQSMAEALVQGCMHTQMGARNIWSSAPQHGSNHACIASKATPPPTHTLHCKLCCEPTDCSAKKPAQQIIEPQITESQMVHLQLGNQLQVCDPSALLAQGPHLPQQLTHYAGPAGGILQGCKGSNRRGISSVSSRSSSSRRAALMACHIVLGMHGGGGSGPLVQACLLGAGAHQALIKGRSRLRKWAPRSPQVRPAPKVPVAVCDHALSLPTQVDTHTHTLIPCGKLQPDMALHAYLARKAGSRWHTSCTGHKKSQATA